MNYRDFLQKVIYAIINPLIKAMIAVGITPNIVTFVGFLGNIVAAGFFLDAAWMLGTEQADYASCMVTVGWGGFIILAAGLFDMMDGRLARMSGKSSLFGATLGFYTRPLQRTGKSLWHLPHLRTYAGRYDLVLDERSHLCSDDWFCDGKLCPCPCRGFGY